MEPAFATERPSAADWFRNDCTPSTNCRLFTDDEKCYKRSALVSASRIGRRPVSERQTAAVRAANATAHGVLHGQDASM